MVARGTHPNSLANLKPAWPKGVAQPHPSTGPVIVPALRRLGMLTVEQLVGLNPEKLTVSEAAARARWLRALDLEIGARDMSAIEDRLDGPLPKSGDINIDNRTQVLIREVRGSGIELS